MARTKTSKSTKKNRTSEGSKTSAPGLFEDSVGARDGGASDGGSSDGGSGDGGSGDGVSGNGEEAVALHEAAQARYLNYSLSVITSRALPDV